MSVSIVTLTPREAAAEQDALMGLYLDVYQAPSEAGPPFVSGLIERSYRPGFKLCAAAGEGEGKVVGFAYGFTGLPGQPWTDAMRSAVGAHVAAEWLDGHFEFAEFGVARERQREGIGAQLYDALFTDLPHHRAVLTVRTGQQPARGFYEHRDWVYLHQEFYSPTGRGPYCIMGRELKPASKWPS